MALTKLEQLPAAETAVTPELPLERIDLTPLEKAFSEIDGLWAESEAFVIALLDRWARLIHELWLRLETKSSPAPMPRPAENLPAVLRGMEDRWKKAIARMEDLMTRVEAELRGSGTSVSTDSSAGLEELRGFAEQLAELREEIGGTLGGIHTVLNHHLQSIETQQKASLAQSEAFRHELAAIRQTMQLWLERVGTGAPRADAPTSARKTARSNPTHDLVPPDPVVQAVAAQLELLQTDRSPS